MRPDRARRANERTGEHELDRHAQVRAIAEAGKQFALERLKMENVYC